MTTHKDFEIHKNSQNEIPVTLRTIKEEEQLDIEYQVDQFLRNGGKIQVVPNGVGVDQIGKPKSKRKKTDSLGRPLNGWHAMGEGTFAKSKNKSQLVFGGHNES